MIKLKIIPIVLVVISCTTHHLSLPNEDKQDILWALEKQFVVVGKNNEYIKLEKILNDNGLIMHFWATWCTSCLEELPLLDKLNHQIKKKNIGVVDTLHPAIKTIDKFPSIVSFSADDDIENIYAFNKILKIPLSFMVLHDKGGSFARELGTHMFPETYLIDGKGKIIYKWIGYKNWFLWNTLKFLW